MTMHHFRILAVAVVCLGCAGIIFGVWTFRLWAGLVGGGVTIVGVVLAFLADALDDYPGTNK